MRQHKPRAVAFVDDSPFWHSFQQVAALVRRHGYQTVRVTTAPAGPIARLIDRLVYDHAMYLSDARELARLPELLEPFCLAELCITDVMAGALDDDVIDRLPGNIAARLRIQKRLSDKMTAGALAAERGALVPEQLPGSTPAAHAVAELGLPIVLKTNYGAAGSGVRIASTLEEVEQAIANMGTANNFFYQRFIAGPIVSYGAMVADEGIVQEMTYQGLELSASPTGAPLGYEVIYDPDFTEIGRSICQGVGRCGPINLQAIRDADGLHWVIDLNIRPFGGMLNYDQVCIDTAAGYLFSTQLTTGRPVHRTPPVGLLVSEFPCDAEELARSGRYWPALAVYLRRSPSFVSLLRLNYLVFAVLNGVAHKLHI